MIPGEFSAVLDLGLADGKPDQFTNKAPSECSCRYQTVDKIIAVQIICDDEARQIGSSRIISDPIGTLYGKGFVMQATRRANAG